MMVWLVFEACEVGANGEENCNGAEATVPAKVVRADATTITRDSPRRGKRTKRLFRGADDLSLPRYGFWNMR